MFLNPPSVTCSPADIIKERRAARKAKRMASQSDEPLEEEQGEEESSLSTSKPQISPLTDNPILEQALPLLESSYSMNRSTEVMIMFGVYVAFLLVALLVANLVRLFRLNAAIKRGSIKIFAFDFKCNTDVFSSAFTWTIPNADQLFQAQAVDGNRFHSIQSPAFGPAGLHGTEFSLTLYPRGSNLASSNYISLFLTLNQTNEPGELNVYYKLALIGKNNKRMNTMGFEFNQFSNDHFSWGYNDYLLRSSLLNPSKAYINDNKLTIQASLFIIVSQASPISVKTFPALENFNSLWESKSFSDITLAVDGREYSAHKMVLASRCKVFAQMFNVNMSESVNNRVEISDVNAETFELLLKYIYTGKIEANLLEQFHTQLLPLADKYQLDHLKYLCQVSLSKTLTHQSVFDIYKLSKQYNAAQLLEKTVVYMRKNILNNIQALNDDVWIADSYRNLNLYLNNNNENVN